ncbi:hypothetical protein BGZ51_005372 [Haplosporangium sp. Z 767]|nr:hypothetical protein BGZ51_005372 [Haplosporangium sp. Z 767]
MSRRAAQAKRQQLEGASSARRAAVYSSQDVPEPLSTQLGRLLISTKRHIRNLLDSFIFHEDSTIELKALYPNLEYVLLDLLNGMLQSHTTFATRDNVSSQQQQPTFRPVTLRSFSHLRGVLTTDKPAQPPFISTDTSSISLIAGRPRAAYYAPSHLPAISPDPDLMDMDMVMQPGSGTEVNATFTTRVQQNTVASISRLSQDIEGEADMYNSTIEFLALMSAFVSIICWLLQSRLDPTFAIVKERKHQKLREEEPAMDASRAEDIEMSGNTDSHSTMDAGDIGGLVEFLDLFDDCDNVLNPIKDALKIGKVQRERDSGAEYENDSMDQAGLFAWYFYLFAADSEGPLAKEGRAIDAESLRAVHFDVILNELYTTHVLSMTAKEHQKDHGQFYTPPGVVDFMWKRATMGYGNLLDRFMEHVTGMTRESTESIVDDTNVPKRRDNSNPGNLPTALIPTALDPCLGVSTFLSHYVRLLIEEAQFGYSGAIWNAEIALKLLLHQICEHVWGIELDGFAFWMARCGIIAALIPLVQRVQELSQQNLSSLSQGKHIIRGPEMTSDYSHEMSKLPRLHLFCSDTLQLAVPEGESPEIAWERDCILQLRNPNRLQFDFIVTNPPYMIRKTGRFSAPDPEVYDWGILGSAFASNASTASGASSSTSNSKSSRQTVKGNSAPSMLVSDEVRLPMVDTSEEDATEMESEAVSPESDASVGSAAHSQAEKMPMQFRPGAKGMMQAYGYFIWFAAQRIKPSSGVSCMITASQWLTLEFATKLRAWLFENCLMDEFFQFEPFKIFSKVQTDSLIFKVRPIDCTLQSDLNQQAQDLRELRTVFFRHTDHHKSLAGILQDYMDFPLPISSSSEGSDLSIMVSSKTREELRATITAPLSSTASVAVDGNNLSTMTTCNYSFAPMMPSSVLTTFLLTLTQDLGGICSAGTKKINRLSAAEPLLWHRGPNTNPVYGLVVRMEYARNMFGEAMTQRWFRPALYWNGKNSPESGAITTRSATSGSNKTMHKEGLFWQGRDRLRLSKKEGSPAESYLVSAPGPQRLYGLCMVDKESVKVLKQQVEHGIKGALALWNYLTDVRNHFQPGLVIKKRKVALSGGQQVEDDGGIAFCSTNQCGSDVPEKIVHPINYGYFSKTQPRQRFFLDMSSLAVTNQCIYLTLNKLSHHYDAQQSAPLIYYLTLLNSSTLQFFLLHHCQYDQQGRMRLFRESMAKIPFQDRDVKSRPERVRYAARLGELVIELKRALYQVVSGWHLTGTSTGRGKGSTAASMDARLGDHLAGSSGTNHGLLDWIRRGGDAPAGVLTRVREQVRQMLLSTTPASTHQPSTPFGSLTVEALTTSSMDTGPNINTMDSIQSRLLISIQEQVDIRQPHQGINVGGAMEVELLDPSYTSLPISTLSHSAPAISPSQVFGQNEVAHECDRIIQAIERAIVMVEIVQWAVDQYGFMLYGIQPKLQKLLELELKIVYGSRLESLVSPPSTPSVSDSPLFTTTEQRRTPSQSHLQEPSQQPVPIVALEHVESSESAASSLGITISSLYRWDGDVDTDSSIKDNTRHSNTISDPPIRSPLSDLPTSSSTGARDAGLPLYATSILDNAQLAIDLLQDLLKRYPPSPHA